MPRWNAEEGLFELTELEERQAKARGNILTKEQASRGGKAQRGPRHTPSTYSAIGRARALKRWAKHSTRT